MLFLFFCECVWETQAARRAQRAGNKPAGFKDADDRLPLPYFTLRFVLIRMKSKGLCPARLPLFPLLFHGDSQIHRPGRGLCYTEEPGLSFFL